MIKITIERTHDDYGFEAKDTLGHTVKFDTSPDEGGTNFGIRPMQSVLMALGTCSGIDVVSILKKQRQPPSHFSMHINGEREKGKIPSVWKKINIEFIFGKDTKLEKANKACQLSIEKYCSVAETLRRAGAEIKWTAKHK